MVCCPRNIYVCVCVNYVETYSEPNLAHVFPKRSHFFSALRAMEPQQQA